MVRNNLKTLRLRLKTGETFIRKDVEEYLVGYRYFVLITQSKGSETYLSEDILFAEYFTNGEYVKVPFMKQRKNK